LGVEFDEVDANGRADTVGVDRELLDEFSTRSVDVETEIDGWESGFVERGRFPTAVESGKAHKTITLATRPAKPDEASAGVVDLTVRRAGRCVAGVGRASRPSSAFRCEVRALICDANSALSENDGAGSSRRPTSRAEPVGNVCVVRRAEPYDRVDGLDRDVLLQRPRRRHEVSGELLSTRPSTFVLLGCHDGSWLSL
jgi:hypothetical protein